MCYQARATIPQPCADVQTYHSDFWTYFEPIRQNMPVNCSADVAAVIAYVDETFSGENTTAIDELKATFGLSDVTHLDDAAGACAYEVSSPD